MPGGVIHLLEAYEKGATKYVGEETVLDLEGPLKDFFKQRNSVLLIKGHRSTDSQEQRGSTLLKTKCIYLPPHADDGLRISILSRHTLDDGRTPDPRIHPDIYHLHWPELGPPPKLIHGYLIGKIPWPEYARQFTSYLETPVPRDLVYTLARSAKSQNVTLLCVEEEDEKDAAGDLRCHRRLVAQACLARDPTLLVEIH